MSDVGSAVAFRYPVPRPQMDIIGLARRGGGFAQRAGEVMDGGIAQRRLRLVGVDERRCAARGRGGRLKAWVRTVSVG